MKGSVGTGADGRPSVQAELVADKLDADAVRSALAKPQSEQGTPPPATGAPPSPTRASGTMIPDTPIPFGPLRLADADVKLDIAQLKTGGALYRAIAGHIVLRSGKLQVDPLSADLPEGHVNASLSADAAQQKSAGGNSGADPGARPAAAAGSNGQTRNDQRQTERAG